MKLKTTPALLLTLLLAIACGKDDIRKNSANNFSQGEEAGTHYSVELVAVNPMVVTGPFGTVKMLHDESLSSNPIFEINMNMVNLPEGITHPQFIQDGVCPNLSHDSNEDGIIDYEEGLPVAGAELLGLDMDIYLEDPYTAIFPKGSQYNYFRKIDLGRLPHLEPVEGKILIIYGVSDKQMPSTVAGRPGFARDLFVPVACGVIKKDAI